jgi:hypothetical protein
MVSRRSRRRSVATDAVRRSFGGKSCIMLVGMANWEWLLAINKEAKKVVENGDDWLAACLRGRRGE